MDRSLIFRFFHEDALKLSADLIMFIRVIHKVTIKSQEYFSRGVDCGYVCIKRCEFNFGCSHRIQKKLMKFVDKNLKLATKIMSEIRSVFEKSLFNSKVVC